MRFFRIGDKVISQEKLLEQVEGILTDREKGSTQEDAARHHGVQRSFVSWLETLGEVRRGARVAIIGFPIGNPDAVRECAERHGVEFVFLMTQSERERFSASSGDQVFNQVLETLATLKDFDVILLLASDWRIGLLEKILGREVVAVNLGHSPIVEDVQVDLDELDGILAGLTSRKRGTSGGTGRRKGRWARSSG